MNINENILKNIINDKILWISRHKKKQPLFTFYKKLQPAVRNFYSSLQSKHPIFILECKKSSPSNGLICKNFDLKKIANVYKNYATVVSVLTDEKYFQGSFKFLSIMSSLVTQPILCKDFIIDPYQIYLARYYQADAILLMLSILKDEHYLQLALLAHNLNMGILTEVNNKYEVKRALALNAKVIGINNRDLHDMSINLNRTRTLAPSLNSCVKIISESGINNYSQIRELSHFVNGFLVGSILMKSNNLNTAVRKLIIGENKICGLTRIEDVKIAYQEGAIYGGLIFIESSPRNVDRKQVQRLIEAAPLKYVSVFKNNSINEIVNIVYKFNLSIVQLHGNENRMFVCKLREVLPIHVKIWKAFSIVGNSVPVRDWLYVDRYVFDNGPGGTNKCFNWTVLKERDLNNVMLAGGLNANNCFKAAQLGCIGLDFNSGVEDAPGIKNKNKISKAFRKLHR